ncbi:MAG: choice-of-anchor J domain-containing protein [Bacteroidales bacterium]|nr:choice-of-anchor J domain-containing protein [Bacteroidales bacterium]
MKKVFTLFVALFVMAFCAKAQVLLQEGFEGSDIPTGWITIDNDGDGYEWYVLNNSQSSSGGFNVHSGEGHITSASYQSVALTPDNWLITPAVTLPATSSLSFWVAGQDANWAAEYYSVLLSTTGTAVSDFTVELTNGTCTGDMTEQVVDLTPYAGQTVYIAFRHYNITDMFRINLDDVVITNTTGLTNHNAAEFSIYPNPATDVLTVVGEGVAEIYNAIGQLVLSNEVNGNAQLNVSDLESGVYFVRMNGNTQRFIKK